MAASRTLTPLAAATASSTSASDARAATTERSTAPSFREIFESLADYVPALLRRLGVAPADVPDLAQDVFTAVHQGLGKFRGDSTVRTWVCGISLRVVRNHRRRAWFRRLQLSDELDDYAAPNDLNETLELRQRIEQLEQVLARLPARERDVFVLFEVEELTMAEIANLIGCPEKTAYTRLYAARKRVARGLSRFAQRRLP